MTRRCSHLDEVRHALTQGHWPHAVAPELRAHAKSCNRCAQEILITTHLRQARIATIASVEPGTPGLLWWRAQLRRRNAALDRAGRPIAAAQAFALLVVLAAMTALIVPHWHAMVTSAAQIPTESLAALHGNWATTPLVLAITLITTLGAVVLYFSTARE